MHPTFTDTVVTIFLFHAPHFHRHCCYHISILCSPLSQTLLLPYFYLMRPTVNHSNADLIYTGCTVGHHFAAPGAASPSTATVLTEEVHTLSVIFLWLSTILWHRYETEGVIGYSRGILGKSRGTWDVKTHRPEIVAKEPRRWYILCM